MTQPKPRDTSISVEREAHEHFHSTSLYPRSKQSFIDGASFMRDRVIALLRSEEAFDIEKYHGGLECNEWADWLEEKLK